MQSHSALYYTVLFALNLISSITFHTVTQRNVPQGFSASKLMMHKKVRSIPFCELRNSTASRCSAVPQELETVYFLLQAPLRSTNHSEPIAT